MTLKDTEKYVRLEQDTLFYKSGFRWKEIPVADITWAYLRVEEVSAKMCCGRANFDMCLLVVWTKDKEKTGIQMPGKEETLQMLDQLKELNEQIEFGYSKEKEALYGA